MPPKERMVTSSASTQTSLAITAALLKKAQDMQNVQGKAAVELIESAKIDQSPTKGTLVDTVA